ncbi:FTR1 family iron permease [Spirochaeta thermophila]|uniref:FTR1 family iron permease n=1 Tax=Winmispira thermophila TaxID=154 RepID=UPI0001F1223C|nr:FTR1 family protein [Spirochaeta thermophila]
MYSLLIILREGVEAILIIMALVAFLTRSGNTDRIRTIYHASLSALVLSVVTAVVFSWVFRVSGAAREVLEGVTILLAAVVLVGVSYWLLSKVESEVWMRYLRGKLQVALSENSVRALWFTAFLAVYREGAETVLFYQALAVDAGTTSHFFMILAGFLVGILALGVVFYLLKEGAMRLPLGPFFAVTGSFLYYMAFVFAGKGVMELIEAGVVEPRVLVPGLSVPFLGIYPYWQTLLPQALLLVAAGVAAVVFIVHRRTRVVVRPEETHPDASGRKES